MRQRVCRKALRQTHLILTKAKSAAYSAALSATIKEERKNEKEEGIYFINRPICFRTGCDLLYGFIIAGNY